MEHEELVDVCNQLCEVINDNDLTNGQAVEVAINFFGIVAKTTGLSVHDAVGGVMQYYKAQHADH